MPRHARTSHQGRQEMFLSGFRAHVAFLPFTAAMLLLCALEPALAADLPRSSVRSLAALERADWSRSSVRSLAALERADWPHDVSHRMGDSDMGFLDVSSEPTGAKILIDDADLGQTTPQHHLPVRVGHHRLTLVTSDGAHKLTVGFTVDAGQTKKLTLYLAK